MKTKYRFFTASFIRQALWSLIAAALGGVTITGKIPYKGGIVVANHTSHLDTVVLFHLLPWIRKPFVVAAKDYWGAGIRRITTNSVIATQFVNREEGNGYEALKQAVAERIAKGELLIIFPEGTRTLTGEIGHFHNGAVRLASDLRVPIYPVALKGMFKAWRKNGGLRPTRMEAVFGEPLHVEPGLTKDETVAVSSRLREQIIDLKGDDIPKVRLKSPWDL